MEHRIIISKQEVLELLKELTVLETSYVKDEYTSKKRIRQSPSGIEEKEYITPVTGTIYRYSSKCLLGDINNIWLEFKWTEHVERFEIEFEEKTPEQFINRPNISGWDILKTV
jgi:hypothetical protein